MPLNRIGSGATTSASTSVTATYQTQPTPGRSLFAIVTHTGNYPGPQDTSWGTHIFQDAHDGVVRVFRKVAGAGETNPVFTAPTAGGMTVMIVEGADVGVLTDVSGSNTEDKSSGYAFATGPITNSPLPSNGEVLAFQANFLFQAPSGESTWNSPFSKLGNDVKTTNTGSNSALLTVATSTIAQTGASFNPGGVLSTTTLGTSVTAAGGTLTFTSGAVLTVGVGADRTIAANETTTVTATATGGSGTKTYAWTKQSGPAGTFANENAASTTFTPTGGPGTYVLRCTVTDSSPQSPQFDELTVQVTPAMTTVLPTSVVSATGWTASSGTVLTALSDSNPATTVTSSDNPSSQVLELGYTLASASSGEIVWRLPNWTQTNVTNFSGTAEFRQGTTTRSTVSLSSANVVNGALVVTFPALALSAGSYSVRLTVSAS